MNSKGVECLVGIFIVIGFLALLALAFNVSGFVYFNTLHTYPISMEFDNIGDLKVRAPVSVSGVVIGRVSHIILDHTNYRAKITIDINKDFRLPKDTSASILTQGILGSNYIGLTPGFSPQMIPPKGTIESTRSALILENLIGQLMFKLANPSSKNS